MAVGQGSLTSSVLDVGEARRLSDQIEQREQDRSVQHAEQLSDVLRLHRVYERAGMGLNTTAEVALLLRCSENHAGALLCDAQMLQRLDALPVMREGVLTVEQARVVIDILGVLDDEALATRLWNSLHTRLLADAEQGVVLPPARLRELLRRWLLKADPDGAVARRKQAQKNSTGVDVWRRDDGLTDIVLRGLTGPIAQAVLAQISAESDPLGLYDDRTEGERRLHAALDRLLGRTPVSTCQPGCTCGIDAQVPCGAQVYVHVMLPTTLGASDEPAELVGRGPIDRDLLDQLLLSAPVLHRVWTNADGVPVAVDDKTWQPPRRDPEALREALLDIGSGPPPPPEQRHPVHPDDHPPDLGDDPPDSDGERHPDPASPAGPRPARSTLPGVLTRPHLADPGPYVTPRRVKRLVRARAPRCEWPACGRRAITPTPCDNDHDIAYPFGPTCACNIGPLCRRHHRIKQLGWIKHRRPDGSIRWTSPTGRSWTTPPPHPVPRATRPIRPLDPPDPLDGLTQWELDERMRALEPEAYERFVLQAPTPEDIEPADDGPMTRTTEDLWTLIHDDSAWHELPDPVDPD